MREVGEREGGREKEGKRKGERGKKREGGLQDWLYLTHKKDPS